MQTLLFALARYLAFLNVSSLKIIRCLTKFLNVSEFKDLMPNFLKFSIDFPTKLMLLVFVEDCSSFSLFLELLVSSFIVYLLFFAIFIKQIFIK